MIKIKKEQVSLTDKINQKVIFRTDSNGDYYFTIHSSFEARYGDTYNFIINENDIKTYIQ